jgi:FkbM family methyltransferase
MRERLVGPTAVPGPFRGVFRDLRPGELAIDCGAHTGTVTAVLAARELEVYAFEPNPHAFAVLRDRFAGTPSVHCLPQAVAAADGRAPLYLHTLAREDPVGRATGSSLLATKGNVDPSNAVEVETVDLDAFLGRLARPPALLKLDVEGLELQLLPRLAASGHLDRIRHVLVEMHDRAAGGGITDEGARVRAIVGDRPHVRLDWG